MEFGLNGDEQVYEGDPKLPLLTYLREQAGICSAKDGCAPQAACGTCTVQLGEKAVLACVTPMKKVADKNVMTTEGLDARLQKTFATAFLEKGGIQCGFCIPGIVMRAKALLDGNPDPTRREVEKALYPNLCRCTGYKKIVDSILYAAEALREGREIELKKGNGRVGTRYPKYNAFPTVLGQRQFVCDIKLDGMQYGALKFSDHPRARVRAIDVREAEALAGVTRVFLKKDIPGSSNVGLIFRDWPLMIGEGETTRYVGDILAGVVAETEAIAREAVGLIDVEYEVLDPVSDPYEAIKPESPKVHDGGNLLERCVVQRGGDADAALAACDVVTHGFYQTQCIEHGYLEPESCVACPSDDGGVKLYSQSQGVYEDQTQVACLLGLPKDQIHLIQVENGGGFGGKEDLSVQGHAALMTLLAQVPVKVTLTRDESILMHPKRHPIYMDYTMGCTADGKLQVLKARIVGDTGAYASVGTKVVERAVGHATGAYHVPVVDIEGLTVYTNNIPCGAMRGFGANQATFALESCIDELCEQGGFDRWQFRFDNALKEGDMTSTGQVLKGGVGLRETLLALKEPFYNARYAGLACGIKNTGIGNGMEDAAKVKICIEPGGRVVIHHGWTEMGQGVHTMALQVLCEETGIDPDVIEVRVDTDEKAEADMTTASRATSLVGNALIDACKALKEDLKTHTLDQLAGNEYWGEWVCDWTTKPGKEVGEIITHYSYSYASQLVVLNDEGRIEKVYAAHDAGKVMNPTLFEGQIEGSLHMGIGYALTEELEMIDARPKSTRLRDCGILRAHEMPAMEVIGVEVPDPHGPYGAKGVGEIGLVPTAGAVANALYQFDKVRRFRLPMKDAKKTLKGWQST